MYPAPAAQDAVYRETEGNPFFVAEVVRLLVAEGRLDAARPDRWSVDHPARRPRSDRPRSEHLDDPPISAHGRRGLRAHVRARPLVERPSVTEAEVLAALGRAIDARLVGRGDRQRDPLHFAHALIRETIYDELSVNRRIRLHRGSRSRSEATSTPTTRPPMAELAHHFAMAAPGGDVRTFREARGSGAAARG